MIGEFCLGEWSIPDVPGSDAPLSTENPILIVYKVPGTIGIYYSAEGQE